MMHGYYVPTYTANASLGHWADQETLPASTVANCLDYFVAPVRESQNDCNNGAHNVNKLPLKHRT